MTTGGTFTLHGTRVAASFEYFALGNQATMTQTESLPQLCSFSPLLPQTPWNPLHTPGTSSQEIESEGNLSSPLLRLVSRSANRYAECHIQIFYSPTLPTPTQWRLGDMCDWHNGLSE